MLLIFNKHKKVLNLPLELPVIPTKAAWKHTSPDKLHINTLLTINAKNVCLCPPVGLLVCSLHNLRATHPHHSFIHSQTTCGDANYLLDHNPSFWQLTWAHTFLCPNAISYTTQPAGWVLLYEPTSTINNSKIKQYWRIICTLTVNLLLIMQPSLLLFFQKPWQGEKNKKPQGEWQRRGSPPRAGGQ